MATAVHKTMRRRRSRVRGTTALTRRASSGSRERTTNTTAVATSAMERMKWSWTANGLRLVQTTIAPTTPWAGIPATSAIDSHTRSRRRGRRTQAPSAARTTASPTTNVNNRLICSIAECCDETSTSSLLLQFGQSLHPRPEPVNRTAAPVTTITPTSTRAATQILWNSSGVNPSERTRLVSSRRRDTPPDYGRLRAEWLRRLPDPSSGGPGVTDGNIRHQLLRPVLLQRLRARWLRLLRPRDGSLSEPTCGRRGLQCDARRRAAQRFHLPARPRGPS